MLPRFLCHLLYCSLTVVFWDNGLDSSGFLTLMAFIRDTDGIPSEIPMVPHQRCRRYLQPVPSQSACVSQHDPAQERRSGMRHCGPTLAALARRGERQSDVTCTALRLKQSSFLGLLHLPGSPRRRWIPSVLAHVGIPVGPIPPITGVSSSYPCGWEGARN